VHFAKTLKSMRIPKLHIHGLLVECFCNNVGVILARLKIES